MGHKWGFVQNTISCPHGTNGSVSGLVWHNTWCFTWQCYFVFICLWFSPLSFNQSYAGHSCSSRFLAYKYVKLDRSHSCNRRQSQIYLPHSCQFEISPGCSLRLRSLSAATVCFRWFRVRWDFPVHYLWIDRIRRKSVTEACSGMQPWMTCCRGNKCPHIAHKHRSL